MNKIDSQKMENKESKKEVISLLADIWNRGFAAGRGEDEDFDGDIEYEKLLKLVEK